MTGGDGNAAVKLCEECGNPLPPPSPHAFNPRRYHVACKRKRRDQERKINRVEQKRARTLIGSRITKRDLLIGAALYPEPAEPMPTSRADCTDGPRPCPMVRCKFNLFLDVSAANGIKINFPGREVEDMVHSCALDIADRGGATHDEIGEALNIVRERVRQIEAQAMAKLKVTAPWLVETLELQGRAVRRLPVLQEVEDEDE